MKQYDVTGMGCAACSARVEKVVSALPGVTACSVNLLTKSMNVEGDITPEDVIAAVKKAGYGASLKSTAEVEESEEESDRKLSGDSAGHSDEKSDGESKDNTDGNLSYGERSNPDAEERDAQDADNSEINTLRKRLWSSLVFLIVLMYFSMGHMMWNWPVPACFAKNHVAMGVLQLLLAFVVMVINRKFFTNGVRGMIHRAPNMDSLVALGSGAAFVYSTYALIMGTGDYYFESAAMILTLITVGKLLEERAKGKTTDALKSLMKLAPKTATIVIQGREQVVPVGKVKRGDVFVVRPGENIPVDGLILEGMATINESALTGESIPVDKHAEDTVSAATTNMSGFIKCKATRVGEDTTLAQIIRMVSDAAATKAPIAKVADKVSGVFVPVVMIVALITIVAWLLAGETIGFALARGISVLVISCPCALGLATPVAIMVGNGVGAKIGVLFKTAQSLEETGRVRIVALDKTGTITAGEPKVTDIFPAEGVEEAELLELAYALEQKSEHPLAKAIVAYGREHALQQREVAQFKALPGNGLQAVWNGSAIFGGNLAFVSEMTSPDVNLQSRAEELAGAGKTPLFFGKEDKLLGIIAVADVIKEDSPAAVKELQDMGIRVVMLTGDNEHTAKAIGAAAEVDEVIAGVLPDGKESVIRSLQEQGKVAMVGDGINDAPALTSADVGIAIGAGTDVAIDAADVVLVKSRLSDVPTAIRLSRKTLKNIHENLFWAFFYNVIGIPLAAGVWIPLFGWELNPMFGAAAMSLSSFCVVSNALRLNFFKK